jgi:adenylate kinase
LNSKRKIIIFIGPPGSGKGSLSNICVEQLELVQLSTGNLCRKHIAEKTDIGLAIDMAIKSGQLVSDEIISSMVNEWLLGQENDTILDGYPRTLQQAEALKELILKTIPSADVAIVKLALSDETVINRLSARVICSNKDCQAVYSLLKGSLLKPNNVTKCNKCSGSLLRRPDDEPMAIEERLKSYYNHEQDLLNFYENADLKVHNLPAERPLSDVFNDLKNILDL